MVSSGGTPIIPAAQNGRLDIVNALIEALADVNTVSDDDLAPLHLACLLPSHYPIVAALLAAGALVDAPKAWTSPLTVAINCNAIETLKLLIAAGADVNGSGYDNKHIATATDNGNLAAADVKSAAGFGSSLLRAVRNGFVEMTKLYISAGADVNMRSLDEVWCLHEVVSQCLPGGTWARERWPDEWNTTPIDYPGVFQVLIEAKSDVLVRIEMGVTPLAVAAWENNAEAVNALLAAGAHLNVTDDLGLTPLMTAATTDSLGAVTALIAAGADLERVNIVGFTALMLAVSKEHTEVASALVAAGADVNYFNTRMGLSVLELAEKSTIMSAILTKSGEQLKVETSELARAITSGDMELVDKLVRNAGQREKNAALVIAIRGKMLPMVKRLLGL
jgi:ankyrin repeat protein